MNILIELWENDFSKKEKDFVDYTGRAYSTMDIASLIEKISKNEKVNKVYVNVNTGKMGSSLIISSLFSIGGKDKIELYFNGVDKDSVKDERNDKRINYKTKIFKIPDNEPCLSMYFINEQLKNYYFGIVPPLENRINLLGVFSGPSGSKITLLCDNKDLNKELKELFVTPVELLTKKQKDEGMDACYYRSGESLAYLLSSYANNIEEIASKIKVEPTKKSNK